MFGSQDPGYEFSAQPRVVDNRPKFRDPYGQSYDYIPQNIMHDRRIARGSTHASMVIPAGNHPDALFLEKKKEQQRRARMQQEEEVRRQAELEAQRNIKTPEPIPGRVNLDIQTEPFVENLTDKPTEFEIGVQSDFYIDRPPTPLFVPQKTGEDAETQVEKDVYEEDVYDFNDIVEPILSVMCFNVIEQAQMEVYEEHEFNYVDTRRKDFEKVRNLKLIEAQRLEATENRRKQEMERRRNQVKARSINRVNAFEKYTSRKIAKKLLANVCPTALQLLEDQGTLVESLGVHLHEQAVPWLLEKTMKFLEEDDVIDSNADELVEEAISHPARAHHETVDQENRRLLQVEKDKEQKQREKEERHRKREEAREAARRAEELKQLKSEIIETGESRDRILAQDITDVDGNYQNIPVMGVVGGPLTQLIVVLSTALQEYKEKTEKFMDREAVAAYLVYYIANFMKTDKFYMKISEEVEQMAKEKDIKLSAIHKANEEKKQDLTKHLTDTEQGMLNQQIRDLIKDCEKIGLNKEVIELVHNGLVDIITTKPPTAKDSPMAKQESAIEKIKLTPPPEDYDPENTNVKAIARIRIPMEEVKEEEEQKSIDKSMDRDKKNRSKRKNKDLDKSNLTDKSKDLDKSKDQDKSKDSKENKDDSKEKEEAKDPNKPPEYREAEIEDRVMLLNPTQDNYNIYVSHQAGARLLRREFINSLAKHASEFTDIDGEEFAQKAEQLHNKLEEHWISQHPDLPVFDYDIN